MGIFFFSKERWKIDFCSIGLHKLASDFQEMAPSLNSMTLIILSFSTWAVIPKPTPSRDPALLSRAPSLLPDCYFSSNFSQAASVLAFQLKCEAVKDINFSEVNE